MTIDRFKELVEQLRTIADKTRDRYESMSPLALAMAFEQDGAAREFLKSIYIAGGLEVMSRAIEEVLDGGCTPIGLVDALDDIVKLHELVE